MARTNAFTTAAAIALVSDLSAKHGLSTRTAAQWVAQFEKNGFDATMPRLIASLFEGVAAATATAAAAQRDAQRLSQTLVGWDANDMAISAEAASYGQHAARAAAAGFEIFAPAPTVPAPTVPAPTVPATPVWLTTRRVPVMARLVTGLEISQAVIIAAVEFAISQGHTANDALGAWIARNGGGGVTGGKQAAARAMGFEI